METVISDPMEPDLYLIRKFHQETHDTFTLKLKPANGHKKFSFAAGQFNMLYVFGIGEIPISISGDPTRPNGLTHTTRAVGAVTSAMRRLKTGEVLGVRGPFGTAWPLEKACGHDVVIVAGGIGLAPLRPALYRLIANRGQYGRIVLLYGARTPEDLLYREELKKWGGEFDLEVYVTVDRATGSWKGNVDVVPALISRAPFDPLHTIAMICGPEIMMRFTVQELHKRGVTDERIYLSMERNMKCAVGFCGHCQFGPNFICKDGPVFPFQRIKSIFGKPEV